MAIHLAVRVVWRGRRVWILNWEVCDGDVGWW
jgi:hypothetical protein